MKKILSIILCGLMLVGIMPSGAFSAKAESFTEGIYTYEIVDNKAKITKSNVQATSFVVIPETLGGYPVAIIGSYAFKDRGNVDMFLLPDSIEEIHKQAFYNCNRMGTFVIPKNVTYIGQEAFYGCSRMAVLTIESDKIAEIKERAFDKCLMLTTVRINDLKSWCNIKFYNHRSNPCSPRRAKVYLNNVLLNNFVVPNGVTKLRNYVFAGMPVDSVVIPRTVSYIGKGAFSACEVLSDVHYVGTEAAFSGITVINDMNDELSAATKHYEYKCENHSYGDYYKADDDNHIRTCDYCGDTETASHNFKTEWQKDLNQHWLECVVCGNKKDLADHKFANATCTEAKTCTVCKITEGKALGHTYNNVVTKSTLKANGKMVSKCSACGKVAKTTVVAYPKTIKLAKKTYTYTGKIVTPAVTVKDSNGKLLKKGIDYTVAYSKGRKNVGTYKVTVTLKGNYSGSKVLDFTINPVATTVKKLTAGKKNLKVVIAKKSKLVTGYQVQYATGKTFKNAKSKNLKSNKTTSVTLNKLSAKKNYFVRVRTYKIVNGKKYYSSWSALKLKKTK